MGYHKHRFLDLIAISKKIDEENIFKRKDWAHSLVIASAQARCLGHKKISVFEFGVATGNGLRQYIEICNFLSQNTEFEYDIYGFDRKIGLPEGTKDFRDNPELWSENTYVMNNYESLSRSLPSNAKLIIGDVSETLPGFLKDNKDKLLQSPIGFVSIDLDLYSSTKSALKIFESNVSSDLFLPSVQMYFDDADLIVTVCNYTGEGLAISEFNQESKLRKIEKKDFKYKRYYSCHVLDHPVRNGKIKPKIPFELTYTDFWNTSKV